MPKSPKNIDFDKTIFFEIGKFSDNIERLTQLNLISYKLGRGLKICNEIYKNCYQGDVDKRVIEKKLAKEYQISVETVRKTWAFLTQPAK